MWEPDWTRRDKTNLCLIPVESYADQENLMRTAFPAAKIIDWRRGFLDTARRTQKRLSLTVESETKKLSTIGNSDRRIFAVINTEYMLAALDEQKREQFWLALRTNFPHLEGIIVFTALAAKEFVPDKLTLTAWRNAGRLIDLTEMQKASFLHSKDG